MRGEVRANLVLEVDLFCGDSGGGFHIGALELGERDTLRVLPLPSPVRGAPGQHDGGRTRRLEPVVLLEHDVLPALLHHAPRQVAPGGFKAPRAAAVARHRAHRP